MRDAQKCFALAILNCHSLKRVTGKIIVNTLDANI